ncbi:MAG: hypothetical protein NT157_01960 [Candidatus Micrarchaeota archaeon]|nr:hypothetical protein [Candidatus Micrarchaeota archaeon]
MNKGFFFTLDAFVALLLALIVVSLLLFFTSTPASFSKSLEQTYFYAEDSANVLAGAKMGEYWDEPGTRDPISPDERDKNSTLLLYIGKCAERGQEGYANATVRSAIAPLIPVRYGYSVQYLKGDGSWLEISRRELPGGKEKLQASAMRIASGYSFYPVPGASPFCYSGYCEAGSNTPCASPISGYREGAIWGPTVIRVSVWI